ncbi:DDE-type integrase/transposase/recombinase [Streptomyces anulatus]
MSNALVEDTVRRPAFTTNTAGERALAPEGLYGRREMLAPIRHTLLPEADFTYVRTYQSFTYVAFIVDRFSQKIVSWHISVKRDVELVDVPLRMALWAPNPRGRPGWTRTAHSPLGRRVAI